MSLESISAQTTIFHKRILLNTKAHTTLQQT